MASVAKTGPDIVGHILSIPVNDIEVGERLRPIDLVWAAGLGRLMAVDGQKTPIEVCRLPGQSKWRLVSGAHRHTGAKLADIAYLKAIECNNDAIERREREVIENLHRKDLDPLDRAAFVGEHYELLRARLGIDPSKDGRAISVAARWQKAVKSEADDTTAIIADVYGITAQMTDRLGLSERTIRNDLTLRRRLSTSETAPLRDIDHPILRNGTQLLALAKLDDRDRAEAVKLLVAGTVKTVSEATALRSQKPKAKPEDKALSAFLGSFGRMSLTEKKGALVQLAGLLTPALIETLGEAIDMPKRPAPVAGPEVEQALRLSSQLFGHLIEGSLPVSDEMIEAAADACEQALHRCGPAVSNNELEEQA